MNHQVDCPFFNDHLNAYLDSELDQATRAQMIRHANQCPQCGERLETMTRLLTMCAELDEGLAVPLDVQSAWRRAVREESSRRKRPMHSGFVRALGTVAAAAVLLVGGTFAYRMAGLTPSEGVGAPLGYTMTAGSLGHGKQASYDMDSFEAPAAKNLMIDPDGAVGAETGSTYQASADGEAEVQQRITLRSAQRRLESTAFDKSMQMIDQLMIDCSGYFEQQSVSGQAIQIGQTVGRAAALTARVPVKSLDEFLTALDAVGTLTYRSELEEDVSSQYFDVSSRLDSYRAQLTRYNELVTTASGLEDMLLLEDKIYELQQEIDALEGQVRDWDSHASKATVTIDLIEVAVREQSAGTTLEERIRGAFDDSMSWLRVFLQDAAVVLALAAPALVVVIPLIIVLCVIVSAVKRRRRRKG